LKINRIMPFCNLFMERPSYYDCAQECVNDVLKSRTAITDLIESLCHLPYVMADQRCSTAVIKCLLSVINNSQFDHPVSDKVDSLSSWAMVFLSFLFFVMFVYYVDLSRHCLYL